ncbi:MAG TPA: Ig-like domain-containing protein [Pyrinomonadaceae bacterium]|jgi:uncharacterized repeat protein (TIGR01451 family)
MNHRTLIPCRRNLRAYAAALVTYVMLAGQMAPLALAAAPRAARPSRAGAPPAAETAAARPAPAALAFAAPTPIIVATKTDAWDDTATPDGKAEPGQTITYTVTVTNTGDAPATGVTFNDSVDPNTTLVPGSVQTQPIAQPETVSAFGNVRISTDNGAPNLLANDYDPDTSGNSGLTASGPTTGPSNGQATVAADGKFAYNPNPGFNGSDSFTYTVTDASGKTDTATVNVTVGPTVIWFIDGNAPAGGDGRITSPFNTIAAFNVTAADEPGDIIFVAADTDPYLGGFTLLNNQKLIGQGFNLETETGARPAGSEPFPASGAPPTINNPGANIVTVGQNNTLRGFITGNSGAAGTDIAGTSFGTLTVSNLSVAGDGRALNLATGTLAASITNISASNTGALTGLTLNAVGGALTVTGSTTITNPGGTGLDVANSPAGTNHSFGATTVNKGSTAGVGVNLSSNLGATTFSSLAITTSNGVGLNASNAGTVNVATGSITAGGGAASLANTVLNLTFTGVSSNGGANGVNISGGSGSFTTATTNLQNNTGVGLLMANSAVVAGFGNTTVNSSAGDAVDLNTNSGAITFADLDMTPDAGLRGLDAVNNTGTLTVTSGDVTTSGGANASAVFVDGPGGRTPINLTFTAVTTSGVGNSIHLVEVSGTKFQVTGTTQVNTRATANGGGAIFVDNSTPTTIQFATVNIPNTGNAGGDGIHVEDTTSAVTVATTAIDNANQTVGQTDPGNDFVPDNDGDGNAIFLRGNTGSFTLNGGTLSNCGNDCIDVRASQNLVLSGVTIDSPGLDVTGGSGSGTGGHGIQAINLTGTNSITNSTITDWETQARDGLRWLNSTGTATLTIHGSTFSDSAAGSNAILYIGDGTATMTLNVGGASAGQPNTFSQIFGAAITHGAGFNADSAPTNTLNVVNNTFTGTPNLGQNTVSAAHFEGGKATVNITGNTFNNVAFGLSDNSGVIDINGDALDAGNSLALNISGNTIQNIGTGAGDCDGAGTGTLPCQSRRAIDISIDDNTNVNGTIVVDGNVITNTQRAGIIFDVTDVHNGSATVNAKITNNTVGTDANPVGRGNVLSAGGESGIRVENRSDVATPTFLNVLVSGNQIRNGNGGAGSALNTSGLFIRAQNDSTMSATATNNNIATNASGAAVEINVNTNTLSPAVGSPTLCVDINGNTLAAGAGTINLSEIVGTLNVEQSQANLSTLNGGAAVTISSGTPQFGVACSTPPAAPAFTANYGVVPFVGAPVSTGATATGEKAAESAFGGGVTSRPFLSLPRRAAAADAAAKATPKTGAAANAASRLGAAQKAGSAGQDASASGATGSATARAQGGKTSRPPVLTLGEGGAKGSGGTISLNIGTLNPGDSVTITFQVVIDNPYSGPAEVLNQGAINGTNFAEVKTDDPDGAGSADVTVTPINSIKIAAQDGTAAEPSSGTTPLLFTVTLSAPAPAGGVSVNYATADGGATPATGGASCGGAVDYESAAGTLAFAAGEQVKTVSVNVCSDADGSETNETLLLNLSAPSGGNIVDAQAVGTITPTAAAGTLLISELRTSGPGGAGDDFVELYNNTDSDLTVAASDASAGYGVFKMGADCNASPVLLGTIPNGTVIPARRYYLLAGPAYSLANYGGTGAAAPNVTTADIEADRNVAVFTTSDVVAVSSARRLDAVGFGANTGAGVCDLMREGTNLGAAAGSTAEYSFFRKECDFVSGVGCPTGGDPKDSNDNAADFLFASTDGAAIAGVGQRLGAPGPENASSPRRRDNAGVSAPLLDSTKPSSAEPNRHRDLTSGANATFGRLSIRRRVVNNTGSPVTRLRFRIVELTTFPSPGGGQSDLRALSSSNISVSAVNDPGTCSPAATPCTVTVLGTTLEQPPAQGSGGGYNSTLAAGTVTAATPLANGASINLHFELGIETPGKFRFYIIVEALP